MLFNNKQIQLSQFQQDSKTLHPKTLLNRLQFEKYHTASMEPGNKYNLKMFICEYPLHS